MSLTIVLLPLTSSLPLSSSLRGRKEAAESPAGSFSLLVLFFDRLVSDEVESVKHCRLDWLKCCNDNVKA